MCIKNGTNLFEPGIDLNLKDSIEDVGFCFYIKNQIHSDLSP